MFFVIQLCSYFHLIVRRMIDICDLKRKIYWLGCKCCFFLELDSKEFLSNLEI